MVDKGDVIFTASRTDWSLFNQNPENRKCAQILLYEYLQKPSGAALVSYLMDKAILVLSVLDYRIDTKETLEFWRSLYSAMEIDYSESNNNAKGKKGKDYDLLMDGPVD
jgi:beta-galactosidase